MKFGVFPTLVLACLSPVRAQDRLVTLSVIAIDSRGQPVADMTADDLTLQDQGKPQRITVFRKNPSEAAAVPGPVRSPHEFSNRSGSTPRSVTVILFDLLHPIDEKFAHAQLLKAAAGLQPGDPVYLYFQTVKGLYPVRDMPEDQQDSVPGGPIPAAQIDTAFDAARKLNVDSQGNDLTNITVMSLQALGSRLAALPGRKSIVWISRGVPFSIVSRTPGYSVDYAPILRDLNTTLQRADVAIYPVGDARREIASESAGTLGDIASKTGGRVHMDMDVGTALREAIGDSRASYTLGYDPDIEDEKYHKVKIGSSRRGVRILAPDGYYPVSLSAGNEKIAIEAAGWSPFDAGQIGVHAVVSTSVKIPQAVHLQIRIDAEDVQFQRKDQTYGGRLIVALLGYDSAGRRAVLKQTEYPFQMTSQQHENAVKSGITLSPDQPVGDAQKIRIVVFDRNSNSVGSVTVPVAPQ